MKLYAEHTIHRIGPKGTEVVEAGTVFDDHGQAKDLTGRNAARLATLDEIATARAKYVRKNGGSAEGWIDDDADLDAVDAEPEEESNGAPPPKLKGKGSRKVKTDESEEL
jgi:hypothetical protein